MTMLAMWRDKESVALTTDGKMTGCDKPVQKLHIVHPNKVMFGIEFGGEAFEWLKRARCSKEHPYPEHWRDCSGAKNTDKLEQIIKRDLCSYVRTGAIRIWLAGVNEQGDLEAFVLDESGNRIHKIKSGAHFNKTIECESKSRGISPGQLFQTLKKAMDVQIRFSGAMALIETSRKLINFCESAGILHISGPLQCYIIIHESN